MSIRRCRRIGATFVGRLPDRDGRRSRKRHEVRTWDYPLREFPATASQRPVHVIFTLLRSPVGFGYFKFISFSARTIVSEITQLRNHFRSAGTTYHGACFVEVFSSASSNAFM